MPGVRQTDTGVVFSNSGVAQTSVIPDGVVTYYDFSNENNDTGIVEDKQGDYDGVVSGATYLSGGGPDSDGAYSFDGNGDEISFGVPDLTDWSLVIEADFTEWDTSNRMVIWSHNNGGSVELVNENGEFTVRGGAGGGVLNNGIDVSGLTGYHTLGYVQNNSGGERVVYLDGDRGGDDTDFGDNLDSSSDAYLGRPLSGVGFEGELAAYYLFGDALTDSEMGGVS